MTGGRTFLELSNYYLSDQASAWAICLKVTWFQTGEIPVRQAVAGANPALIAKLSLLITPSVRQGGPLTSQYGFSGIPGHMIGRFFLHLG